MAVLVLAEHDLGTLSASTARIVAAAQKLGPVDVLVAGPQAGAPAIEAAKIEGVQRVGVAGPGVFPEFSPEALVDFLLPIAANYTHIVAAAATLGRDVIPRLAAKLDVMPVTDVVEILGPNRFVRPVYAGNALETVASSESRHLLTVRASAFSPAQSGETGVSLDILLGETTSRTKEVAQLRTDSELPDLSTAQIVVGGGVSFGSAEKFALVSDLAKTLGAAVGATRAAVDAGYAPNDWQVGQTGKIIAPDIYIAIGISGALQHLAGIQGAKKIIAVNTDPEAPIVKIADIALIGDLFEIVPALTAELGKLGLKR